MNDPLVFKELAIAAMLGLIGGVIPGPVITAVFTEILRSGFQRSLRIIAIAFVTESLVALVSLLLFSWLGLSEGFFRGLSFAGALILIWIGLSIWKV
jgi:threonine/homoserine/homoserine lactone efflux protein